MSGIIYGYIESLGVGLSDEELSTHNAQVLASLPSTGSMICREMFSQLPSRRPITYYAQIIHFATEPKELWVMDHDWLRQFEELLTRLMWSHSELIETASGQRFEWNVLRDSNRRISQPVRWTRKAFESYHQLKEVPFDETDA